MFAVNEFNCENATMIGW